MTIEVNNETTYQADEKEYVELARYVFEAMHLHPATELGITLIDESAMADLHLQWMDLEGPTDVMSFPMDEIRQGSADKIANQGLLGDIFLCPEVAHKQALKAGHSTDEELLLLTTHGILHLLGYDHQDPESEAVMFSLQRKLLLTFLAQKPGVKITIQDTGEKRGHQAKPQDNDDILAAPGTGAN